MVSFSSSSISPETSTSYNSYNYPSNHNRYKGNKRHNHHNIPKAYGPLPTSSTIPTSPEIDSDLEEPITYNSSSSSSNFQKKFNKGKKKIDYKGKGKQIYYESQEDDISNKLTTIFAQITSRLDLIENKM